MFGGLLNEGERVTVSMVMEDSKKEQEMKVKRHKNGFVHKGIIYNSTIRVDE